MDEPKIDEAAAAAWLEARTQSGWPNRENAARAALAWKARAEEWERIAAHNGEQYEAWKGHAEAAEAELRRAEGEINRMRMHGVPCDCKDCR